MKVFHSHHLVSGPLHPHLHVNGFQTHPIVILFNALVTGKRIIFLGHKRPAGEVSTFVLSACALGSGCGSVLRGFIERAFPYASLNNRDDWESVYVELSSLFCSGCLTSASSAALRILRVLQILSFSARVHGTCSWILAPAK